MFYATAAAKSLQSCPTLRNPIDGSPPGSPVPGILQARTLEWVAISFSNAWTWKGKGKLLSRVQLFTTPWTAAHQAPLSMGFSRQEYWSGLPFPGAGVGSAEGMQIKTFAHKVKSNFPMRWIFLIGSQPERIGLSDYRWTSQCLPVMFVNVVILLSQGKFSASRCWEGIWGAQCSTEINTHERTKREGTWVSMDFVIHKRFWNQPLMDTERKLYVTGVFRRSGFVTVV